MKQHLKKIFGPHVDAKVYSFAGAKQPCRGVKFPPLDVMRAEVLAYHKIDQANHYWDDIESAGRAPEEANGKSVISGKETGWDSLSHFPFDDVPWSD